MRPRNQAFNAKGPTHLVPRNNRCFHTRVFDRKRVECETGSSRLDSTWGEQKFKKLGFCAWIHLGICFYFFFLTLMENSFFGGLWSDFNALAFFPIICSFYVLLRDCTIFFLTRFFPFRSCKKYKFYMGGVRIMSIMTLLRCLSQ